MLVYSELIFTTKNSILDSVFPRSYNGWFDWTESPILDWIFPRFKQDCFFEFLIFNPLSFVEYLILFSSLYLIYLLHWVNNSVFYHPSFQYSSTLLYIPSKQYSILRYCYYCRTCSGVPLEVHCCNNKYIRIEVLYLRYNRRNSYTTGMCTLRVKKIFILVLPSIAIFKFP